MLRRLKYRFAVVWLVSLGTARTLPGAIFPDQIGDFTKGSPKTVAVQDLALYGEYGFEASEQAEYTSPSKHFTATAWRMHDSTGALALFEARRPAGAVPSQLSKLAVTTSDGVIFAYGNYVFQFTGSGFPPEDALQAFYGQLPRLEQSALPALISSLPKDGLVPNSERYILGPVSLERFDPQIPPSVAAFHMGAEGQLGKYKVDNGLITIVVFSYPTPNMARDRYDEFAKIPGAIAKRVNSLVAATVAPPNPDAAERVLAQVQYQTSMTWNQGVPADPVKGMASLILNIFIFSGIVIVLGLVAGLGFGGYRMIVRKMGKKEDPYEMITLHLGGK